MYVYLQIFTGSILYIVLDLYIVLHVVHIAFNKQPSKL